MFEYYGAARSQAPVVLVGKGVTFDTGGISLKPPAGMDEMKFDMGGAASVFGTMKAVLELELPLNVVGVVPACENMPSGRATKPGDIVKSMSGQTIEVLNTDAEGRLILCDAITYSRRFKPEVVIDLATLTGACVIALGNHLSGLFSNDDELAAELKAAGDRADDRAWHDADRRGIWRAVEEQLRGHGQRGRSRRRRHHGGLFPREVHRRPALGAPGYRGHRVSGGANKGSTGRPVPLLVDYLINKK